MTVAELMAELQKMNPESLVVLQKDAEGNGYSPLRGVDDSAVYVAESTYSGTAYSQQDAADGYSEAESGVPCVVLHPIN
jgi:hypothetical protein